MLSSPTLTLTRSPTQTLTRTMTLILALTQTQPQPQPSPNRIPGAQQPVEPVTALSNKASLRARARSSACCTLTRP